MKTTLLVLSVLAMMVTTSAAFACDADEHHAASTKDAVFTSAAHEAGEVTQKATFKVGSVMCESCEKTIHSKLEGLDGFRAVKFTRKKDKTGSFAVAEVTFVPGKKVTNDSIIQAINSTGEFKASLLQ